MVHWNWIPRRAICDRGQGFSVRGGRGHNSTDFGCSNEGDRTTDLGRVAEEEVLKSHLGDVADGPLDDLLDSVLHSIDQALQPDLDVAFGVHGVLKLNPLILLREHLSHAGFINLVESDIGERVEQAGLEVWDDTGGVRAQGQDLKQGRVGHEVEAGELGTLGLEVRTQRLRSRQSLVRDKMDMKSHLIMSTNRLN